MIFSPTTENDQNIPGNPRHNRIVALLLLASILLLGQAVGCSDKGHDRAGGSYSQQQAGWVETSVRSSVFTRLAYDYDSKTARAFFHNGAVYDYFNVPEDIYEGWLRTSSKGRYFHRYIREKYRYKRIGR